MSEVHDCRSTDTSDFSDIHMNPFFVLMTLDPIFPTTWELRETEDSYLR
jgi:hypothetical protein